jgi:mono/diheme cytochrome c family protein
VLFCLLASLVCGAALAADTADPTLIIQAPAHTLSLKRSELLARRDVETIDVDDVSYKRRMHYTAVKMAALLAGLAVARDAALEFVAADGFVAMIPFQKLRNTASTGAVAYLAIEDPRNPWPRLKRESAGPFYVVWVNPERSAIAREQWPFRVARVIVKDSLERAYPAIQPAADADAKVKQGYVVFANNCLPCHRLNDAGPSQVGPDLNLPLNPTEYFREGILQRWVRDPQSVRLSSTNVMPPFPRTALSDADLDALVAYLQHMAPRKVAIPRR